MIVRFAGIALAAAAFGLAAPVAMAAPLVYSTSLSGAAENPVNASSGTGTAVVTYDDSLHTLRVQVNFSGLDSSTTVAHIHCCVAAPGNVGVATQVPTFVGFPIGVTAGSYDWLFDLTDPGSWNGAFLGIHGSVGGAETALAAGLAAGQAYLNIHTGQFPGGEIRGFLAASAVVPEPGTLALFGVALAGFGVARRTRQRA